MALRIPGIYVEIKGDYTQLKADLSAAHQVVNSAATGMSNALNNALSPKQAGNGINALIDNLARLNNASKLIGKEFDMLGVDLGQLQKITGLTSAEFGQLQSKLLQTKTAQVQERALRDIARAAGLTTVEIRKLGAQMGVSAAGIDKVAGVSKKASGAMDFLKGSVSGAMSVAGGLIIARLTQEIAALVPEVIRAGVAYDALERSFFAVTGSVTGAAETIQFLRSESSRLGQNFHVVGKEFKNVAAAAKGTAMEGENVREMFSAIVGASTALGLSADDTHGTLRALQQMMSKGNIQAEELRGQLGERLPGALNMMARAMKVSTAELNKMMEQGELLADEALPKLTVEINKMYEEAAKKAALESGQSAINRLSQAWTDLKINLFDADAFVWATNKVTGLINAMNGVVGMDGPAARLADLEEQRADLKKSFGGSILPGSQAAKRMPGYAEFQAQLADIDRQIRRTKEELQSLNDPAKDGFMALSTGMDQASSRSAKYAQEVEKGRQALVKYIQTERERALAAYNSAKLYANTEEERARALQVYNDALAAIDAKAAKKGASSSKDYKKMLEDGKKAAEALDKYWDDYEQSRIDAIADSMKEAEKANEQDLKLMTEFADKHREIVLGETAFKIEQLDLQAAAYIKAGSDEIAVAQWVDQEKRELADLSNTGVPGLMEIGMDDATKQQQKDLSDYYKNALPDAIGASSDAIGQFARDMASGSATMEDAWVSLGQTISDVVADILKDLTAMYIKMAIIGIMDAAPGWFGGFNVGGAQGTSTGTGGGYNMGGGVVTGLHGGGVVGSESTFHRAVNMNMFTGAPRFHNGLMPDEFPAILQKGEGVFTQGQMAALGGGSNVTVNVVNNTNAQASVKETKTQNGTRIDVMIEDIVARSVTGRGKVGQAIQTSFRMSYKGS